MITTYKSHMTRPPNVSMLKLWIRKRKYASCTACFLLVQKSFSNNLFNEYISHNHIMTMTTCAYTTISIAFTSSIWVSWQFPMVSKEIFRYCQYGTFTYMIFSLTRVVVSVSRRTNVSSREKLSTSRSRLGWWSQRLSLGRWASRSHLGLELLRLVPIPVSNTQHYNTQCLGLHARFRWWLVNASNTSKYICVFLPIFVFVIHHMTIIPLEIAMPFSIKFFQDTTHTTAHYTEQRNITIEQNSINSYPFQ